MTPPADPLHALSHLFTYLYPPSPLAFPPTPSLPPLLSLVRSLLITHLAFVPLDLLLIADQLSLLLELMCCSLTFSLLLTLHLEVLLGYLVAHMLLGMRLVMHMGGGGEVEGVYRVFKVAIGVIGLVKGCVRYWRYRREVGGLGWRMSWGDRVVARCRRWREERGARKRAREEAEREREEEYEMMIQYIRRQKKSKNSYMDIEARERLLPSMSSPLTPAKPLKKRPPPKSTVKSQGYLSIAESST